MTIQNGQRLLEGFKNQCSNELRNTSAPNLDIRTLGGRVAGALKQKDYKKFSDALSGVHGAIHNKVGCVLRPPQSAAYDPVFWMHHSFVDKVFAIWQERWIGKRSEDFELGEEDDGFLAATRDKRMEPFDNPEHNDYQLITDRKANETWDYRADMCYAYDELRIELWDREIIISCSEPSIECRKQSFSFSHNLDQSCHALKLDGPHRGVEHFFTSQCKSTITTYVGVVVPKHYGGELEYELCYRNHENRDKHCKREDLSIFGALPDGSQPGTPLDSSHFKIRKEQLVDLEKPPETDSSNNQGSWWVPDGLYEFNWSSLTLLGGGNKVSPVPPFMVFEVESGIREGGEDSKEFVHLPKGVSKSQYGDMLNDYQFVLNYCDTLNFGDLSFPLGDRAECA